MDEQSDSPLPAPLLAAWGLRGRPGKGPKPGLSVDRIVGAGIAVADSDGLGAVSMSRVAGQLGAATMSLYRYVAAKDDLIALMVDVAYGPPPSASDTGWRAGMAAWASAMLAGFRSHPWVLQVPIQGLPTMPNEVAWTETALTALRGTGLTAAERLSVLMLVSGYTRNQATMQAQIEAAFSASHTSADEAMASYSGMLRAVIDERRFPELSAVLATGVMDRADGPDNEFDFGLARILDGVDALVRARDGQAGVG
ncbi:MAG TPA: TetR/AcrR family transcriptional regulator C-terminal domain-containing protein [Pseudonocardiaceae bacterium]